MEPHRVRQETAYPSLAYGLFGLGRFLPQIPDSYMRVIFMSICGSIRLSLDRNELLALHRHALALNPCVIAADTDLKYLATLGYRDIFEFRILKGSLNKGVPH